jgi:hypothetical protein
MDLREGNGWVQVEARPCRRSISGLKVSFWLSKLVPDRRIRGEYVVGAIVRILTRHGTLI